MIKSCGLNGGEVYHLSGSKSVPEFVREAQRGKSLRKDFDYQRRLELLQDFDFPISCGRVRISNDRRFIAAVGVYPPEVRMFDTVELGLKFVRAFSSEVVDFDFLTPDYRKLVFLHPDRSVEFHAQGGRHHVLRLPKAARSLCFLRDSAELLMVGSADEIYRLDLEAGMFASPVKTKNEEINCCKRSPTQFPLVFVGGSDGLLEVFDRREWGSVAEVNVIQDTDNTLNGGSITALDVSPNGLMVSVGTSAGICRVYDVRSSRPLYERDHHNLMPIVDLYIVNRTSGSSGGVFSCSSSSTATIVSADKKSIKIWSTAPSPSPSSASSFFSTKTQRNYETSSTSLLASLEPELATPGAYRTRIQKTAGSVNSVAIYPDSGLLFVAQDNPKIGIYFVPKLGLAPTWCSFLDGLTEEMEEKPDETVYEDFQLVTRAQLLELGAENLIGTPVLRAYMHGYFMDSRLYQKLKAVAQPFLLDEYRKQKIEEKLAKKRKMRIQIKHKIPSVNQELAAKLEAKDLRAKKSKSSKSAAANQPTASAILSDERFAELFSNPGFAIENLSLSSDKKRDD